MRLRQKVKLKAILVAPIVTVTLLASSPRQAHAAQMGAGGDAFAVLVFLVTKGMICTSVAGINASKVGVEFGEAYKNCWNYKSSPVGCLSVPVSLREEADRKPTGQLSVSVSSNETIAILVSRSPSGSQIGEAAECLMRAIHTTSPHTRIIDSEEFLRSVFSYRVPDKPAARTKYFELLFRHPILKQRINALGIRYVFFLERKTTNSAGTNFHVRATLYEPGRSDELGQIVLLER